jgi:hypothetical protein
MQYDLYIQVENGQTINHPALRINLLDAFGKIPANWEPFVRLAPPEELYKTLIVETPPHKKVGDVWVDAYTLVDMTAEEKAEVQQMTKDAWANMPNAFNFTAWVYNPDTNKFDPPVPRPTNGHYRWYGPLNNWREAPIPEDQSKSYKFDFVNWVYVEV